MIQRIWFAAIPILCLLVAFASIERKGVKGCVARWNRGRMETAFVPLPPFDKEVLSNRLIQVRIKPDMKMETDTRGAYCYDTDDERVLWVTAYVEASNILSSYHRILSELDLPTPSQVHLTLQRLPPGEMPFGTTMSSDEIILRYAPGALDPTILRHEVGHIIHLSLISTEVPILTMMTATSEGKGIVEGTANLLSALYSNDSVNGRYARLDGAEDLDRFVHQANLPTRADRFRRWMNSPRFAAQYPVEIQMDKRKLESNFQFLEKPDPYLSSPVVYQPLWKAAQLFGTNEIQKLYLKVLYRKTLFSSYRELARSILDESSSNKRLCLFLRAEYSKRGLLH